MKICHTKKNMFQVQITSTLCGQHSTARVNNILASSGSSSSTAAFHNLTELGICSKAKLYLIGVIKDLNQQVQLKTAIILNKKRELHQHSH